MQNLWSETRAIELVETYAGRGVTEDVALRVYTTRLLGSVPSLVRHGGGNTSVKTVMTDIVGDQWDVLCVKGSGWDMAVIEPAGLPAVKLPPLLKARKLSKLSDEEMVALQRSSLIDPASPNPSVETLLHAFLPHKFVDHTHSTAILSLVDQENSEEICAKVFGNSLGFVPYVKPGFDLAKAAAVIFEARPDVEGLILDKHGIFTFAETAALSYGRMIDAVRRAESHISETGRTVFPARAFSSNPVKAEYILPTLRGAVSRPFNGNENIRFISSCRQSPEIMNFVNGRELTSYASRGVSTPDLVIRMKNRPLILPAPGYGELRKFSDCVKDAVSSYITDYEHYFGRCNAFDDIERKQLDPLPRLVLVPEVGIVGLGQSKRDAEICADIGEIFIEAVTGAEMIGTFAPLSEEEIFKLEYWSLEQAKLKSQSFKPLSGNVVLITGGAGAIGRATSRRFAEEGAEVVIFDLDEKKAQEVAHELGNYALAIGGDVTKVEDVDRAFISTIREFGGLDIVVSNAGAACQGEIGELEDRELRKSFELNFFAHQSIAQHAVEIFKQQGIGGALLFNTSKQAINPGPGLGAYGAPKAATLFLCRQYALEYGHIGVRANAVNADRIRSGLLTDEMIASRAKARKVTEREYMSGNLLGREVTADDVAQAFINHALALSTTGDVTTVDGGNIAAVLR